MAIAFPLFGFINTGSFPLLLLAVILLSFGQGLTYGPQSALFCEMFPARVRYSGASIAYGLGSLIGGAFTPDHCNVPVQHYGHHRVDLPVLLAASVISIIAVSVVKDRSKTPGNSRQHERAHTTSHNATTPLASATR